jgi:hypothetical protein
MRSTFTSVCLGSLLVPSLASAVFAQSNSIQDSSVKRPFLLHAAMRSELPKAEVIIGEDGARITRRVKINPALAEQINQARAQTHGNIAVHYMVPGHMTAGF